MDVNIRGYDKRLHIFMSYKRKRMARKAVKGHLKGPKPKGMSGCGIWYCTDLLKESGKLNFILAGIMTEYIKERSLLVGVRINAITEILRTMFSEDFHVSRTVKFK
jgi:hypothetical protein